MKSFLKYSGIIATALAVVAFVLLMATPSIIMVSPKVLNTVTTQSLSGIDGIFGAEGTTLWAGLLSWILALVGIVALVLGVVLPLLKVDLGKFARVINIVAVVALVLAGVFAFFEVSALIGTNPDIYNASIKAGMQYKLGAGWIISAIMLILSGACALLPMFVGDKN